MSHGDVVGSILAHAVARGEPRFVHCIWGSLVVTHHLTFSYFCWKGQAENKKIRLCFNSLYQQSGVQKDISTGWWRLDRTDNIRQYYEDFLHNLRQRMCFVLHAFTADHNNPIFSRRNVKKAEHKINIYADSRYYF